MNSRLCLLFLKTRCALFATYGNQQKHSICIHGARLLCRKLIPDSVGQLILGSVCLIFQGSKKQRDGAEIAG